MIRIRIYGCNDNKILKRCLSKATMYFLNKLLPKKRNIEILVRVVKDLLGKEVAYGECYNYSNKNRPSNYVIQLDAGMRPKDIISTLAHEMVHVKQFDKRELVFLVTCNKWIGERYDKDIAYADYPWEHEAERLEIILASEFCAAHSKITSCLDIK